MVPFCQRNGKFGSYGSVLVHDVQKQYVTVHLSISGNKIKQLIVTAHSLELSFCGSHTQTMHDEDEYTMKHK